MSAHVDGEVFMSMTRELRREAAVIVRLALGRVLQQQPPAANIQPREIMTVIRV